MEAHEATSWKGAHHGLLLVAAEGVASEDDLLEDDPVGVDSEKRPGSDRDISQCERRGALGQESEHRRRREDGRRVDRGDRLTVRLHKALKLVFRRASVVLGEDRADQKPLESAVEDERLLARE
eukprot:4928648-Pleurochrysis_carterae.AAC.1